MRLLQRSVISTYVFQPISKLEYVHLNPNGQAIVIFCPSRFKEPEIKDQWKDKAAAAVWDSEVYLPAVVRDLLANPQIRVLVFHGQVCGRAAYEQFFSSQSIPNWGIDGEHITRIRQFIDLYDDDFVLKGFRPPHWPSRIITPERPTL